MRKELIGSGYNYNLQEIPNFLVPICPYDFACFNDGHCIDGKCYCSLAFTGMQCEESGRRLSLFGYYHIISSEPPSQFRYHQDYLSDDFSLHMHSKVDTSISSENYPLLDSAEAACRNDTECFGIYDERCDNKGPFLKTKGGFSSSESSSNCFYKKKRYEGK